MTSVTVEAASESEEENRLTDLPPVVVPISELDLTLQGLAS